MEELRELRDKIAQRGPGDDLSADQRRTKENQRLLSIGVHPATHRPLLKGMNENGEPHTCGECIFHHRYSHHSRSYHKCELHRLGESHSAASDIRISWPACERFEFDA